MPAGMTGGPVQQIMLHTSYTMQSYQGDEDAITVSWQVPRHNDVHVGTASNPSGAGGGGGGGKRMTSYNEIAHNDRHIHVHLHAHTHMHTHMHNPPHSTLQISVHVHVPPS